MSTAIPDCSPNASASRSSAGARPKSSSALGRSSTARRLTFWSVSTICSRSSAAAARADSGELASSTCFRPSRIEVRAWPGLVVELAREPAALELLTRDHPAQRVAGDPVGEVDGHRRARAEGLGQAQVLVGEARVGPELVVRGDHPDRPVGDDHRHEEARAQPDAPGELLVDLDVLERRVDALAPPPLEHASALRGVAGEHRPDQLLCGRPGGCLDPQVAAALRGSRSPRAPRRSAGRAARRSVGAAAGAPSRPPARSRSPSATRAGPASASPTRTGARSRSRRRPGPRAA